MYAKICVASGVCFSIFSKLMYMYLQSFKCVKWEARSMVCVIYLSVMADCPHTIGVEFGTRWVFYTGLLIHFFYLLCYTILIRAMLGAKHITHYWLIRILEAWIHLYVMYCRIIEAWIHLYAIYIVESLRRESICMLCIVESLRRESICMLCIVESLRHESICMLYIVESLRRESICMLYIVESLRYQARR